MTNNMEFTVWEIIHKETKNYDIIVIYNGQYYNRPFAIIVNDIVLFRHNHEAVLDTKIKKIKLVQTVNEPSSIFVTNIYKEV